MTVPPLATGFAGTRPMRLLAIETSTDRLSVAVGTGSPGGPFWQHSGPGGAQASLTLLPLVHRLLGETGWALTELDAVVFGRGPGSFTGLRTACAVAQGLAYGAGGLPVLPVDTLLALAEQARRDQLTAARPLPKVIVALLDARMHELYVAPYACSPEGLTALQPPCLCAPQELDAYLAQCLPRPVAQAPASCLLAGNAFDVYPEALASGEVVAAASRHPCLPTAEALLHLAPALLAAGAAVAARDAMPLYVRDKVAQTTAERETLRLAQRAERAEPMESGRQSS